MPLAFAAESRKVSFIKGITWRIIGTLDTIFLAWLFTGKISQALTIGGVELFTKILLFYLHERIWIYSKIGKREIKSNDGITVIQDRHWRSAVKALSWRITGSLDTITISYFVTGNIHRAFEIGFTEVFTKMLLYYLHERFWIRITKPKAKFVPNTDSANP